MDENTRNPIHEKTLEILRAKGFRVHSSSMRERLRKAGAAADDAREVVTIPAELVTEATEAVPSELLVHRLDGQNT